jgi:tetratricopeptide (TPR) repeat protein
MPSSLRESKTLAGLAILLAVAYLAYWPGLSGGFLFDDFVNLDAIGATGPVDDWNTFLRYLTSGNADPTGRPLALLSFLVDARDWPAEPGPFLRTNLLLHLGNGALLLQLLLMLGRALDGPGARRGPALLGAGLWLLHPLFVSTTLYIVQRETMLPATAVLAGLIAYVHGRGLANAGASARAKAWMLAGIGAGTGLALLCKANGALLPLLAGVLELTVLRHRPEGAAGARATQSLQWLLLWLPGLLLLAWLASFLPAMQQVLPDRGWSVADRLLTEARVLCQYLWLLVLPRSVSTGLYNDAYAASTGWLHPPTTLPAVLFLLALALAAWSQRRRWPVFAAAIGFFLGGHLLESTVVPLELYFEHRNYLPAMLLFWFPARALFAAPLRGYMQVALATLLLAWFAVTTFQRATLWGQPERLAALWALQNPESSRAQSTIALLDTSAGHPELAVQRLGPLWQRHPYDLQLALNYINARCVQGGIPEPEWRALLQALSGARGSNLRVVGAWTGKAIDSAAEGGCRGLDLDSAGELVEALAANPDFASAWALDLRQLQGQLAVARAQPALALAAYDEALRLRPSPDAAARQAASLAAHGYHREALAHLDLYESLRARVAAPGPGMPMLHRWVLARQGYWETEMRVLRAKLHAEIDSKGRE